jgi:magnesium chelatase family protein
MPDCVHPCGNYLKAQKPCACASAVVTKYQNGISGPILDRIDIHIEVPRVDYEKLSAAEWVRPLHRFGLVFKQRVIYK